jgi:Fe-S-cluster containining protein
MEFTLDLERIRQILRHESTHGRTDIADHGVLEAMARSQGRHDDRLAKADDAADLACRAGCAWCCHFSVDVRAAEVFRIIDFVEHALPMTQRDAIVRHVRENSALFAGLDEEARSQMNVKCPFLSEARCAIYPVRPQSCRNYHATDSAGCQQSYEHPEDADIDPDFAPGVYQAGAAHVEAFAVAMQDAGYDVDAYEMNLALNAALSDGDARTRFLSKQPPFEALVGERVLPEFDDLMP